MGTATSGPEALASTAVAAPHCVVLDHHMADDRAARRAVAAEAGADAFVVKGPLDFADLERAALAHCGPTRPARPSVPPPAAAREKAAG